MSTPEANVVTAMDESSDDEACEEAIGELETANECDALADLVPSDGLAERAGTLLEETPDGAGAGP